MGRAFVVLALLCSIARADDIPKLSLAPPGKAQVAEGKKKNVAALMLHRAKKYDAAVAGYIDALKADPSNTIARYNLASVLVTKGDTKRALDVLAQFQVTACDFCLQRLRDAQADKEWKPLWADARFKKIVAFAPPAAAPAPPAAGKVGPPAPIAEVQIETANHPDRYDDPMPLATDRMRVHVWTVIDPGFYSSPKLDIVLIGAKGEVSRTPLLPAMERHRSIEVAVPGAGHYAIEVVRDGKVVGGAEVFARETRCVDGSRKVSLSTGGVAEVRYQPFGPGAQVRFEHHALLSGDGVARVEWWRGGKRVKEEEVELARDLDAACPLAPVSDRLDVPDQLAEKTAWEARIYERGAQAYALTYAKSEVTVKAIKTPAKLGYEKPADAKMAAEAAALRAKLRGTKDTGPLTDAELPIPATAPQVFSRSAKETALKLPKRPAVSPDGKVIAYDNEVEFYMFEGQCAPPAGRTIELVAVKDPVAVATYDPSTFEPLVCGVDKLAGGFTAAQIGDDYRWQIKDGKGAVVAELDGSGANHAELCYSAKRRVAVLMAHGQLGGECDVVGGWWPVAAKY
ncbi:MAG: hypothetical protein JNL83_28500 [Myxococcales bacterium]|nr:hypothetical protein [Myxococcales bacterium]